LKIRVKFLGTFFSVVNTDAIDLELMDGATVSDAFSALKRKFGKAFGEHAERLDYLMVFVNNVEYRQLQGQETILRQGDSLTLGHVAAGG